MDIARVWIWLSAVIALLVSITSILGILNPTTYAQETSNWALQAVGQDSANLVVVVVLLFSTYFLAKNSLKAYLVWLGCYIYLFYAFVIYAFFIHFNYLFLIYVAILGLSVYIPVGSIFCINFSSLSQAFTNKIAVKPASILLMSIGILFGLLWLSEIIPSLFSKEVPQSLVETALFVNPVYVLDLGLILPAMMITSILVWRRKLLGYVLTVPLLVFSATMGLGIIILFVLVASRGGAQVVPPAVMVSGIVLFSTYFSYHFLSKLRI